MTHLEKVGQWIRPDAVGVEIGAFKAPIPGLTPFYVDCFEEYAGEKCLFDFKGDACHLPFRDSSLDYVATSHVFEHVANPIQALHEWGRVLRDRGIVYAVIPDKKYTWDRARPTTPAAHLLEDYRAHVAQRDPTHIDDFVSGINWAEFAPGKSEAEREAYRRALREATDQGLDINIHFHTFEAESFAEIVACTNREAGLPWRYRLLDIVPQFPQTMPNGFLAVLRVHKPAIPDQVASLVSGLRNHFDRTSAVLPGVNRHVRPAAA